jgi:hypothetical protein
MGGSGECDDFLLLGLNDLLIFLHPWGIQMAPRLRTVPLPLVAPGDVSGNYGNLHETGLGISLGSGNDHHQSTQRWTDTLVQMGDASTSLATAKPNIIQNNSQPEVSYCLPL